MPEPDGAVVLGAGVLGIDLASRLTADRGLRCALVVGRPGSTGLQRAEHTGYRTSSGGIEAACAAVEGDPGVRVVFDVSDAINHAHHRAALAGSGALLVNLTPADTASAVVPALPSAPAAADHVSLISCTGQATIPILAAITEHCAAQYAEVVTTAAAASVGRATRRNLDEYLEGTEAATRALCGIPQVKLLVSFSAAQPPPVFRMQITVLGAVPDPDAVHSAVNAAADAVRAYSSGYRISSFSAAPDRVQVGVEVSARSPELHPHAGNVEIINAAAVRVAELHTTARAR